ncbi:hypothetical protein [Streptomyces venezuelae]|uniref:hypothetical protein n=1 Tax=Streptomyces venezuelae TaxID=54571 RepID=UPI0012388E27|nr:hypothetical protein [Streptomyces venezuelae]
MSQDHTRDSPLTASEKLREDLLRMAARLAAFSEELTAKAALLRSESGDDGDSGTGAAEAAD